MAFALEPLGWNLGIATALAVVVWSLCRTPQLQRRPAVCHALWMLVLLKLVTPPLLWPQSQSATAVWASETALSIKSFDACCCSTSTTNTTGSGRAIPVSSTGTTNLSATVLAIGLLSASVVVTCGWWLIATKRHRAISRLLDGNTIKSRRAERLLRNVSRRFGLKRAVGLRVVDAQISPMLWGSPRNTVIVLPRHLAESLSTEGLRNILAHELAHYVRRDHWSNLFAFAVATLLWWNPISWLARRQRAAAAEACCDALALERLHGSRKSYATTLLTVVESLAARVPMQSAFSIAFGESRSIRRRFEMIADSNVHARMTRGGWLLLTVGLLMLVLAPAIGVGRMRSSSGGQIPVEFHSFCCPASNS